MPVDPPHIPLGWRRIGRGVVSKILFLLRISRLDVLFAPRSRARRSDRMEARIARARAKVDLLVGHRSKAEARIAELGRAHSLPLTLLRAEQAALGELLNRVAAVDGQLRRLHDAMMRRRDDPLVLSAGEGSARYALRGQIARLGEVLQDVRRLHVDLSAQLIEFD
jgi:hypothetical protein